MEDFTKLSLDNTKLKNQIIRLKKILDDLGTSLVVGKEISPLYKGAIETLIALYDKVENKE